jgi:hypothetical protein
LWWLWLWLYHFLKDWLSPRDHRAQSPI